MMNIKKGDASHHGWICPKCGTVHAPWVATCLCDVREYTGLRFPNHPIFPFNIRYKQHD